MSDSVGRGFFGFPEIDPQHEQDAVEWPVDGFPKGWRGRNGDRP
ncbi:hypothetical protein ABZU45_05755 [Streptomyces avermitilis]